MNDLFKDEIFKKKEKASKFRCKKCLFIRKLDYRSGKRFFYCEAQKCNRSGTGFKKIKANDPACWHFSE